MGFQLNPPLATALITGLFKIMTMLTSLVSDSMVDTFVVAYKFGFDFSLFRCKVTCDHSNNWVATNQYFLVKISIQYFSLNFSIKY